jgi:hypothetical protein
MLMQATSFFLPRIKRSVVRRPYTRSGPRSRTQAAGPFPSSHWKSRASRGGKRPGAVALAYCRAFEALPISLGRCSCTREERAQVVLSV